MANFEIEKWWKATEIPLTEFSLPKIKKYFHVPLPDGGLDSCVYVIRLAPPFAIWYGDGGELESPLVYVGSGNLKQRWLSHTDWLIAIGLILPSARYELWFCKPTRKGPGAGKSYKDVEADVLKWFKRKTGYLPLWNKKEEKPKHTNTYEKNFFEEIIKVDSRYHWTVYPRTKPLKAIYEKGASQARLKG